MNPPDRLGRNALEATFIDSQHGSIFVCHHAPQSPRGHVLFIPPFNEEMNRSRAMLTLQAKAFAQIGLGSLLFDPIGTGDSAGEHIDARWEIWLANIDAAVGYLAQHGGCLGMVALRSGVLLGAEWLKTRSVSQYALTAWQPIIDGKQYFTQFLRIRIAANLDRTDTPKETTTTMREQLSSGKSIEIAGYDVHPELAQAFEARNLLNLIPPKGTTVSWMEHQPPETEIPSPASAKVVSNWNANGVSTHVTGFEGQAFWQLHERALAEPLVEQTTRWWAQWTQK